MYRSNCTRIAERSSKPRSSPSCALSSALTRREQPPTDRRRMGNVSDSLALSSLCCVAPYRTDHLIKSRCSSRCYNHIARRSQKRQASRRIASRSGARCVCPSISAHRCQSRRATCEPSLPTSPQTSNGVIKLREMSSAMSIDAPIVDKMSV